MALQWQNSIRALPDERIHPFNTYITSPVNKSRFTNKETRDTIKVMVKQHTCKAPWGKRLDPPTKSKNPQLPVLPSTLPTATLSSLHADTVTSQSPKCSCCGYSHPCASCPAFGHEFTDMAVTLHNATGPIIADTPATATSSHPQDTRGRPHRSTAAGIPAGYPAKADSLAKPSATSPAKEAQAPAAALPYTTAKEDPQRLQTPAHQSRSQCWCQYHPPKQGTGPCSQVISPRLVAWSPTPWSPPTTPSPLMMNHR